ncbi:MAG: LysM peptidoglycan-binding domain-containing protein [Pyrinomonadaceae bacterium]
MKNLSRFKIFVAVLAFLTLFGAIDASAQTRRKRRPVIRRSTVVKRTTPTVRSYMVASGQVLRARINSTLTSNTSRVGDTFTADVTEPVYSNGGVMVIPTGSVLTGRVNSVVPGQKGGKPGSIDVSFISLKTPNGTRRVINGTLTDLDAKNAKTDSEGTTSGGKMNNRKLIFIGGGGAGGAVLGGALGGGKGALIGGIIGAVAGGIAENRTKGENAEVRSGTELGVYLNQSVSFPKFSETVETSNDNYNQPSTGGSGRTYIVQSGDTLGKISQRFYGTSRNYMKIYNANRDKMSSPGNLEVGEELIIP